MRTVIVRLTKAQIKGSEQLANPEAFLKTFLERSDTWTEIARGMVAVFKEAVARKENRLSEINFTDQEKKDIKAYNAHAEKFLANLGCRRIALIESFPCEGPMAQLRINTGFVREIFDHDHLGQVIGPEKAITVNVCIPNELTHSLGRLPLLIVVRVQKSGLQSESEAEETAIQWLQATLPARLEKAGYWNFFEHTWLNQEAIVKRNTKTMEFSIPLTERLEKQASEALQQIRAVRANFEAARERLAKLATETTAFGFAQSRGEGRVAIQKIADILAASADYGGYTAADARSAIQDYEELARRKDESNFNYKNALNSLRSFAYGVNFPTTWRRRPN